MNDPKFGKLKIVSKVAKKKSTKQRRDYKTNIIETRGSSTDANGAVISTKTRKEPPIPISTSSEDDHDYGWQVQRPTCYKSEDMDIADTDSWVTCNET